MKKGLLSLAAVALMGASGFSQGVSDITGTAEEIWDAIKADYTVTTEDIVKVPGLKGLTSDAVKDRWTTTSANYNVSVANNILKVGFEKKNVDGAGANADNWDVFGFSWAQWKLGDGSPQLKAKEGRDVLFGTVLDLTAEESLYVEFEYKASAGVNFRFDLRDYNGHLGNGDGSPVKADLEAATDFTLTTLDIPAAQGDQYGGNWWDVNLGRYGETNILDANGDSVYVPTSVAIPLDMSQLIETLITIDEAKLADLGKTATIEFKNFVIGDPSTAVEASTIFATQTSAPTETLTVYLNGEILTVESDEEASVLSTVGVEVAKGVKNIDLSGVAAGCYLVKAGTAQATIVK